MILVLQCWWVGVRVKQYAFVSAQWKHSLRDGEPLAGHFSCRGQRFPWQVSLNGSFVFRGWFLADIMCPENALVFSPSRFGLKPNDQILAEDKHKALWVWTFTVGRHMFQQRHAKCWGYVPPNKGDAGRSLLPSWHPSRAQNSRVVYISPQLNRDPQEWTRPHFDRSKFSDALMQTGNPHFIINLPPPKNSRITSENVFAERTSAPSFLHAASLSNSNLLGSLLDADGVSKRGANIDPD